MSAARYVKKPVVVEALQFTGSIDSYLEILEWWQATNTSTLEASEVFSFRRPLLLIATLEGTMAADPGDWIIRGVQGEVYPCKPEIFEATYQRVDA